MSAQLYNIAPDAIADPGTPGGPGFTLSRPEWIAIQAYSTDALALPTTADAFRKSLGAGAPTDLSDFNRLIEAYEAVHAHVTTWTTTTFPASVALAGDVYQYGTVKAPVYYPRILDEAKILERDPHDEQAKAALKAMLDSLKRDADEKSGRARQVSTDIAQFAADSELDKVTLVGGDGKGGLVKYYDTKYGSTSTEVEQLIKDIADQKRILKTANDEYDHDVVVAATTPTYAWFWPLGTIAAAVVAGVYGKRATDALDRARAAQGKIDTLADKLAADANLLVAIHNAEVGAGNIVRGPDRDAAGDPEDPGRLGRDRRRSRCPLRAGRRRHPQRAADHHGPRDRRGDQGLAPGRPAGGRVPGERLRQGAAGPVLDGGLEGGQPGLLRPLPSRRT